MRSVSRRWAPLAVAWLCGIVLAAGFWLTYQAVTGPGPNCSQVQRLTNTLHALVEHSYTTLGRPGTAGYHYYHAHPHELADALAALKVELRHLQPYRCNP